MTTHMINEVLTNEMKPVIKQQVGIHDISSMCLYVNYFALKGGY